MNAERAARPTYWASGGTVMNRLDALPFTKALTLFQWLGCEAWACRRQNDSAGASYCAAKALELALAIVAADDWRCAAEGRRRSNSRVTALRTFTQGMKPARYG
jgi:hypothetical protein